MKEIEERIKQLPMLPDIIFDLQKLKDSNDFDTKKILDTLEENHFVPAKILQMANSKLFGFSHHVDTLSKALSLYGINFTVSIAIAQIIEDTVRLDFGLYNTKVRKYINLSKYSLKLMWLWIERKDILLKEQLIIPCLIHELGKSFISSSISSDKVASFVSELKNYPHNITFIEKKFTSYTSCEVTALILKHWNFDEKIVAIVNKIDLPNNKASCVLDVIKTACNPNSPLTTQSIELAIKKSDNYNLNTDKLKQSLDKLLNLIKNDI